MAAVADTSADEAVLDKSTIDRLEEIEPGATAENKSLVMGEEMAEYNGWDSKDCHIQNPTCVQDLTRLVRSVSMTTDPPASCSDTPVKIMVHRVKSDSHGRAGNDKVMHIKPQSTSIAPGENSVHCDTSSTINAHDDSTFKDDSFLESVVRDNGAFSPSTLSTDSQDTPLGSINSDFSENQYSNVESKDKSNSIANDLEDEEYVTSATWRKEPKHVFVLTEAGKPVYSRHGSEDKLAPLMGVLLALVSCVYDRKDTIRHVIAGDHKFVFMPRAALILVGICSTKESIHQVSVYLNYIYNTIISVLTLSQLTRIYETQKNFDLRRLLTGTDKFINNICNSMDHHPQFLLQAVQCLPISGNTRDIIGQALQLSKTEDLAFSLLISNNQIVNICRLKEHSIHPADLHLILNLVSSSSTAFHTGESWTPICLPNFNPNGFLHAHISYLDESYSTCLLLLSADRNAFFTLSESKNKVLSKLRRHNCLQSLVEAGKKETYSVKNVGISCLRHFMYKSKSTSQFTCPDIGPPYNTQKHKDRIFGLYQHVHGRIHDSSSPLKLLYMVSDSETMLGWVTTGFELYAVFGPMVSKNTAITAVNRLLRWIKKQEDDLFLLRPPTF